MIAFEHNLKSYRLHNCGDIEYLIRIDMSFHIQTNISKKLNFAWADSPVKMIYAEIRGKEV